MTAHRVIVTALASVLDPADTDAALSAIADGLHDHPAGDVAGFVAAVRAEGYGPLADALTAQLPGVTA